MQVVRGLKIGLSIAAILAVSVVSGCGGTASAPPATQDPPPPPPPTQLTMSNIGAASLTSSGATIGWTTNIGGTSQVDYGTTASYGSSTQFDANSVTSHSVALAGLQPATQYDFRVRSKDSTGSEVMSANFTFTTLPNSAPVGPVISSVSASPTVNGATITWSTDVPADDQVSYGTTTAYGQNSAVGSTLSTSHSVMLSGLQPGTNYDYQVKSKNSGGVLSTSGNFTFTTQTTPPPPSAPVISSVGAVPSTTAATVTWQTDVPADDQVNYGTTTAYGTASAVGTTLTTSHSVKLSSLQASTTYDYQVKSKNSAGVSSVSGNFTFTTLAAPPVISNVNAVPSSSGATITWNTDKAADQQVDYGTTTSYGQSSALGSSLTTAHSVTLSGLTAATTYDYRVKSRDGSGNLTISGNFTFVTTPASGAQVLSYISALPQSTSATITWRTSLGSDTQVDYGPTSTYGQSSTLDSASVTVHSAVISGLAASNTYNFRVKSKDSSGTLTTSGNYTFTTNATGFTPATLSIGWNNLANTNLQPVCPPNASYAFFDFCPAVVSAWSGGIPDYARNRLIVWGGGHVDYYGNEVFSANAGDQSVHLLTNPGPPADPTADAEVLADGTPNSRHTYDGLAYIAHADRMWAFSGSLASNNGNASQDTWTFNLATNKWQHMDPVNGTGPADGFGIVSDYDPNTKNVFVLDIHSFLQYNFDTNTYTVLNGNDQNTYLIDYHDTAVIDPHRKLFIILGGSNSDFKVINIAPGSDYSLQDWGPQSTGCGTLRNATSPGLAYDPVQDRIIGWAGGNTVYTLNPDTKTCTTSTFANGPGADQGNGTFGRFRYMPGINAFMLVNDVNEDVYVLKLTTP